MQVDRLDHLVLTVRDIDASIAFYTNVLGMSAVVFAGNRRGLCFGGQRINLHERGKEFEPKALRPTLGSADICLITRSPLSEVVDIARRQGVEIIAGPVARTGAAGPLESVYFRDPDGNLIEVSNETGEISGEVKGER